MGRLYIPLPFVISISILISGIRPASPLESVMLLQSSSPEDKVQGSFIIHQYLLYVLALSVLDSWNNVKCAIVCNISPFKELFTVHFSWNCPRTALRNTKKPKYQDLEPNNTQWPNKSAFVCAAIAGYVSHVPVSVSQDWGFVFSLSQRLQWEPCFYPRRYSG